MADHIDVRGEITAEVPADRLGWWLSAMFPHPPTLSHGQMAWHGSARIYWAGTDFALTVTYHGPRGA